MITEQDKIAYQAFGALQGLADLVSLYPADVVLKQLVEAAATYKHRAEEARKVPA